MMSHANFEVEALPNIDQNIQLSPEYIYETESFVVKMQGQQEKNLENMNNLLNKIRTEMSPWQRNFFVNPTDNGFTLCPGPNIDHILFSNGLKYINKAQLDLYTLQWLFSIAMGIYVLHSKDIDYLGLTGSSVFIDTKFNARLSNFSYELNGNDTKVPNQLYYFSPEQSKAFESKTQLNKQQKKMADIYMFGILLHEITTRYKHSDRYFHNESKIKSLKKLKEGAIEYMNLKKEDDIPFKKLLFKCLDPDPNKRCTIESIIEELLNISYNNLPKNQSNEQYFNINNVDLEKYHQYIIDIIGFKQKVNYKSCKNLIYKTINEKEELDTVPKDCSCSFDDLKEGYSKGLSYCITIIDECIKQLKEEKINFLYRDFRLKNPQVNEFDIMKTFIKYENDEKSLENELINLKFAPTEENMESIKIDDARNFDSNVVFTIYYNSKYNTFFTKMDLPNDINSESITSFLHSVERMSQWEKNFFVMPNRLFFDQSFTYCPGLNIYSFLAKPDSRIEKSRLDLYTLEWIFSIAMGIKILHDKGIYDLCLNDKLIFIDYQMRARILKVTYPLDKHFSTVPYPCYFYSRERFLSEFPESDKNSESPLKMTEEQKKKADVYMFGIIAHELLTRKMHYESLRKMTLYDLRKKFVDGAQHFLNLDKEEDSIPLCYLLKNCLKNDPNERFEIKEVVGYLLDIQNIQKTTKKTDNNYLDLSKVDLDEYHKFIVDSIQLDPSLVTDFSIAKSQINHMMSRKTKVHTILKETHDNCSFKDLESGSVLGITQCDRLIDTIESILPDEIKEKYQYFIKNNQKLIEEEQILSKFDIMKIFLENKDNADAIDNELNETLSRLKKPGHFICLLFNMDNDQNVFKKFTQPNYFELPFNLSEIGTSKNIVQPEKASKNRIKAYENLNLYNFLYDNDSHIDNQITTLTKLKWLFSVIGGIKEIHQKGYYMESLTCKNVYIDENLNAYLFAPKVIKINSIDDSSFFEELEENFLNDEENDDISIYYRPPELLNNGFKKIDYMKCDIYSFGILTKEIMESNIPWMSMKSISKGEQLDVLRNPRWHLFSKSSFNISDESDEFNDLITILNNCLKVDPNERDTAENLYSCFYTYFESIKISDDISNLFIRKGKKIYPISNEKKSANHDSKKKLFSVDKSYIKNQFGDIKDRVNRCKSKYVSNNLLIGSISNTGLRQIALRLIQNTDYNVEINFLVNNTNYGVPNGKALNMRAVNDALNDFKENNILTKPISTNKKGDAIMKIARFDT